METLVYSKFPEDKISAGSSYWKVFHNAAAIYPKNPSKADRIEFIHWLKQTIKYFPCRKPCSEDAMNYLRNHKQQLINATKSRKELFNFLCQMHNTTNEKLGKPQVACEHLLSEDKKCESCEYVVHQDVPDALMNFKKDSVKVFKEFCKRDGLPVPEIVWGPCPAGRPTSCNIYIKDTDTGKPVTQPVIHLNPNDYGLRSIIHEYLHYYHTMNGRIDVATDEGEIEKQTQKIINVEFPSDKNLKYYPTEQSLTVMADTDTDTTTTTTTTSSVLSTHTPSDSITAKFPRYAEYLKGLKTSKKESVEISTLEEGGGGGIVNMFEGVFEPIAKPLGVPTRYVAEQHFAGLLSNIVTALQETHLSAWGNVVATTISGIALFAAGVFMKDSLAKSDRNIMASASSFFIYHNLHMLANPGLIPAVQFDAKNGIDALLSGNIDGFMQSLIDPHKRVAAIIVPAAGGEGGAGGGGGGAAAPSAGGGDAGGVAPSITDSISGSEGGGSSLGPPGLLKMLQQPAPTQSQDASRGLTIASKTPLTQRAQDIREFQRATVKAKGYGRARVVSTPVTPNQYGEGTGGVTSRSETDLQSFAFPGMASGRKLGFDDDDNSVVPTDEEMGVY